MQPIDEKTIQIHNGVEIPTLGYRLLQQHGDIQHNIAIAYQAGFRHFDIEANAKVEMAFGQALQALSIPRHELFITAKIANSDHGDAASKKAYQNILKHLKTDYLDLLLIDWPNPKAFRDRYEEVAIQTWRTLEEAYKKGNVRAIGVANYEARHIEFCLTHAEIAPMVNQARIYPGFPFSDNVTCAQEHKILTEGFLPIDYSRVLHSKELTIFAEKYKVTPLQICARYLFEKGILALTFGDNEQALKEIFDVYNFTLSKEDIKYMDVMKNYGPENINPDEADF